MCSMCNLVTWLFFNIFSEVMSPRLNTFTFNHSMPVCATLFALYKILSCAKVSVPSLNFALLFLCVKDT